MLSPPMRSPWALQLLYTNYSWCFTSGAHASVGVAFDNGIYAILHNHVTLDPDLGALRDGPISRLSGRPLPTTRRVNRQNWWFHLLLSRQASHITHQPYFFLKSHYLRTIVLDIICSVLRNIDIEHPHARWWLPKSLGSQYVWQLCCCLE